MKKNLITRTLAIILILLCGMIMLSPSALATQSHESDDTVPSGDASTSDASGDFIRVAMVPLNVDIPYFYQEVTNVSGMYIFILPDGTVYKRIYGSLDGVYGWYIPNGENNSVTAGAKLADTEADTVLYEQALANAPESLSREGVELQDYAGILPPEGGVVSMPQIFGLPVERLVMYILTGMTGLCIIILIARGVRRSKNKSAPTQNTYYFIDE